MTPLFDTLLDHLVVIAKHHWGDGLKGILLFGSTVKIP